MKLPRIKPKQYQQLVIMSYYKIPKYLAKDFQKPHQTHIPKFKTKLHFNSKSITSKLQNQDIKIQFAKSKCEIFPIVHKSSKEGVKLCLTPLGYLFCSPHLLSDLLLNPLRKKLAASRGFPPNFREIGGLSCNALNQSYKTENTYKLEPEK